MSITAKAIGTIIEVKPLESGVGKVSGKPWSKQTYVLETDEKYPARLAFDVWGDHINEWGITLGDVVAVDVEIVSREFNERWYTGATAYKAERVAGSALQPQPARPQTSAYTAPPAPAPASDDLPF